MLNNVLLLSMLCYSIIFQQDIRYNFHKGIDVIKYHINQKLGKKSETNYHKNRQIPQGVIEYQPKEITENFDTVLGLFEPKKSLKEIIDIHKNKEKYQKLGAQLPQRILLQGRSGQGKSLLIRAFAHEINLPLFLISGSEITSPELVAELFDMAKNQKACILCIDNIDLLCSGTSIFTQLLYELDMLNKDEQSNVIFMATSIRPACDMDDSLVRAGHFDRIITLRYATLDERKEIIELYKKTITFSPKIDPEILAKRLKEFRYSTIFKIFNEAGIQAAQKNKESIDREDVDEIIETIEYGDKITSINNNDRKITAYHEAGHALINILTNEQQIFDLYKISIIPRMKAAGATYHTSRYEEYYSGTKDEIIAHIMTGFGGYAAEEIIFGSNSAGVCEDLKKITGSLSDITLNYGMSQVLGKISTDLNNLSQETRAKLDQEIKELSERFYQKTKQLLLKNKDKLILLAEELLKKEFLYKEDVYKLLGIEEK